MGSIIEELVGVKRKPIKMIIKIFLIIEYHKCISFRVSKKFCSRFNDRVASAGQGYAVSSNMRYDL